ncbi:hypothetical protein Tco_1393529 [Tanacetum coccineum]
MESASTTSSQASSDVITNSDEELGDGDVIHDIGEESKNLKDFRPPEIKCLWVSSLQILGRRFKELTNMEDIQFEGLVLFSDGIDAFIYQMSRMIYRFRHLSNEECNRLFSILLLSDRAGEDSSMLMKRTKDFTDFACG